MGQIRKRHSAAFKAKVAFEAARQQKTIAELAKRHQVYPVQISQWKKQLVDGLEGLFENGSATRRPDSEKLQAEPYEQIGRLQMELAWVKNVIIHAVNVAPHAGAWIETSLQTGIRGGQNLGFRGYSDKGWRICLVDINKSTVTRNLAKAGAYNEKLLDELVSLFPPDTRSPSR